MADFCHECDPGGLGCCGTEPCPEDCIGDFTKLARKIAKTLHRGFYCTLGICEGCGAVVILRREDDGFFVFEHVPLDPRRKGKELVWPYSGKTNEEPAQEDTKAD